MKIPETGEINIEPNGNGVSGEGEEDVGVGEVNPGPGVALRPELMRRQVAVNDVEVDDKHDGREHDDEIAGGYGDEYEAGGRAAQFGAREHHYGEHVGDEAEAADEYDEPAVDGPILEREAQYERNLIVVVVLIWATICRPRR